MTKGTGLGPAEQRRSSELARRLIAGWDARTELPLVGTRKRTFNQQQLALAHALTAHVHYLAAPALDLLGPGGADRATDRGRAPLRAVKPREAGIVAVVVQWYCCPR